MLSCKFYHILYILHLTLRRFSNNLNNFIWHLRQFVKFAFEKNPLRLSTLAWGVGGKIDFTYFYKFS